MKQIILHSGEAALVDDEDYDRLSQEKWYLSDGGYAISPKYVRGSYKNGKYMTEHRAMHVMIMGDPPMEGLIRDHKNRIRLDNRRDNLRWVTWVQNSANVSPIGEYKGVTKDGGRWSARLKGLYLGAYGSAEEAAMAHDKAARHFSGEYAYLNFPDHEYEGSVRYVDFIPDKKKPVSEYPGVSYFGHGGKRVKRWRAIYCKKTLGYFHTEEEAAQAYREAKDAS